MNTSNPQSGTNVLVSLRMRSTVPSGAGPFDLAGIYYSMIEIVIAKMTLFPLDLILTGPLSFCLFIVHRAAAGSG